MPVKVLSMIKIGEPSGDSNYLCCKEARDFYSGCVAVCLKLVQ